jgi:tetratricopeptide (TPR) repeat protein
MASIIEGYNYDIFISYRQKDNKYDGWVTEFVDYLRRDIEAAFKEDISIYFDENPNDGLLEMYNVDKSLGVKIKSVILIPVISQTYCDPDSFAWQNEFAAFNKMASEDQFGRDIRLADGNVCSRIIPIRIHDLDPSDTELIEGEMGCRLRSIDFIYSASGVNRPLKPDDNPDSNMNKTIYRDQINKVANAVKEVIYGLHSGENKRILKRYPKDSLYGPVRENVQTGGQMPANRGRFPGRYLLTAIAGLILILALIFVVSEFITGPGRESSGKEALRKTVAVMPVLNFTGNPGLAWIADMIQSDLTGQLQGISNLTVRPMQTTYQFRDSKETVQEIARKLSVENLIESSIKGTEENLQVEIRVVEAFPEERYLYRSSFTSTFEQLTTIYNEVINRILRGMKVNTTEQEEKILTARRKVNPEVRRACARGFYYLNMLTEESVRKAVDYFNEAIKIDPSDPEPYIGLSAAYGTAGHGAGIFPDALQLSKENALRAIELDPEELHPGLGDAHIYLSQEYFCYDYEFEKAVYHLQRGLQLNPNSPAVHYLNGWYLALQNDINGAAGEMKKAIDIDPLDPRWPGNLAWAYQWFGFYEESLFWVEKTLSVNPDYPMAFYVKGMVYSNTDRHDEAIEIQNRIYNPRSGFAWGLGVAYALAGQRDKALEVAAEIEKRKNRRWFTWGLAEIYAALGDNDRAIFWIEEAYRLRHDFIPWLKFNPQYSKLLGDPRIDNIVSKLNLTE